MKSYGIIGLLALGLLVCACGNEKQSSEPVEDPQLADLDVLLAGAPDKADLVDEKTDEIVPRRFVELTQYQSPVKSQGRRGVCSIFSTVAYMEHLYIKEGTYTDPDFSEQYLQWSAKVEVGAFPNTSGSNASSNIEAISRFGIVSESDWPYETTQWNSSDDPDCAGDENLPTKCYTNGDPPTEARAARKWKLPAGRWTSSRPYSIKAHMVNKRQGVVVGLTFFYQSWNHGRSQLPTNSEYKRLGYVLFPNSKDREVSLQKRAGHSILLVGWDDDLEAQKMDAEGNGVVDADGDPVMEKGFFLFKNSWGTGSFGRDNPQGDGYGWISYDYVEDYGSAYVSDLPVIEVPDEICGDEKDNDLDGDTDCDDSDCAGHSTCQGGGSDTYESNQQIRIPDNDDHGILSEIEVPDSGPIRSLSVTVDITHTYSGDLEIILVGPNGGEAQLKENSWNSSADIHETFVSYAFDHIDSAGTWALKVVDHASMDTGTLDHWSLTVTR